MRVLCASQRWGMSEERGLETTLGGREHCFKDRTARATGDGRPRGCASYALEAEASERI